MTTPRKYFILGGAEGAGKSSALVQLGSHLARKELDVAVISETLVDSAKKEGLAAPLLSFTPPFRRFPTLHEAAASLTADKPDVLLLEASAQASDLTATVGYGVRRLLGDDVLSGPLSVLVEPALFFGGSQGSESGAVASQLREAHIVILNKIETASRQQVEAARKELESAYPQTTVFETSIGHGVGMAAWFERLLAPSAAPSSQPGRSEFIPVWFNCAIELSCQRFFDGNEMAADLGRLVQNHIRRQAADAPSIQMEVHPTDGLAGARGALSIDGDGTARHLKRLDELIASGELVLHVKGCPNRDIVQNALTLGLNDLVENHDRLFARIEHSELFRP